MFHRNPRILQVYGISLEPAALMLHGGVYIQHHADVQSSARQPLQTLYAPGRTTSIR